jgi:hypothetical protein
MHLMSPALVVAHVMSFVPALVVRIRRAPATYVLVAAAFAMSAFADLIALGLSGHATWAVSYVLAPVQVGTILWALGSTRLPFALFGLALGQVVFGDLSQPDVVVTVAGSVAVLWLARDTALAWPLFAYFGAGTVCYLMMAARIDDYGAFMLFWYAYQGARLGAFGLFARAAWRADA